MLKHTGWCFLLLFMIGVVREVESQHLQVVISQIRYSCPFYPCSLRVCGYVLPSLRSCPIPTTTCPDTNCQDVTFRSSPNAGNSVGLRLAYPPQLKSILNIKVYFPQSGSAGTCGSTLRDSCWDFTNTNTYLITGSSLSFQVQISKTASIVTFPPSTVSPTSRPTPLTVVSTLRPVPSAQPLPTPFKANSEAGSDDGFPAAAAFGIALGIAVLLLILAIIICLCCKKKKKETVVAVVSSPRTTEKLVYPAPLRYEEYMKAGPLPVVQDDGDDGSDTSCYQIEMVADPSTPKSKKKRKKKRKSGKHSRREKEVHNESDFSRTTGENYHIAVDTFFINAATLNKSEDAATPLTLPPLTPDERTHPKKYKKKRKMASYDFTEFDVNSSEPYVHM